MISEEKLLKLFKKFAGETVNLFGLVCVPFVVKFKENHQIVFTIQNPNDVSYFYSIVEDELLDIVNEFGGYISTKLELNVMWGYAPKFYLNGETRSKIQKVFDSVKEIKFTTGTPFIGYERWIIQIESIGLLPKYFDGDSFYIDNKAVPILATKNGQKIDIKDAIEKYIDVFLPAQNETYYESEEYYEEIDTIIIQYPLINADYVATYYDTKFIM
jgi:hypothetical protein